MVIARLQTSGVICMEEFKTFPAMARFNLRDEGTLLLLLITTTIVFTIPGKTIAIGKVIKILE